MKKELKVPKTLGACADLLYRLREQRQKIQAQADEIEEQEKLLKEHLIQNLSKEDAEGVSGKVARVGITQSVVASAKDWDAFYAYVLKKKDFSLLQKRFNDGAIRERWEAKEDVPGVVPFTVLKVSLTKV